MASTDGILLNPNTKRALDNFCRRPRHALLIFGAEGVGKQLASEYIIKSLLETVDERSLLTITPNTNRISIEQIRDAQHFVTLSLPGKRPIKRIIEVRQAQLLTTEAQNALLKLLEEPPSDTLIILSSTSVQALLPTIVSRCQTQAVQPLDANSLTQFFLNQGYSNDDIQKAYLITEGRYGLMKQILDNQADELLNAINMAKQFITYDRFQRLIFIDSLLKEKIDLATLLEAMHIVTRTALKQAANQPHSKRYPQWLTFNQSLISTLAAMPSHPIAKLQLTNLALSLP